MNTPKNLDFFPEINERDAHLVAPDIYASYRDTEEDFLHDKYLNEFEVQPGEKSGAEAENELGELPFDEKADRTRWEKLEKDFDRLLLNAAYFQ